tara:strand:- start:1333 stop:1608 length:276 start_codon:yes stop_codon:yes gene_type:complete
MKVKAIPMADLFKQNEDIYTDVVIAAKRSRQIIDQNIVPIDEFQEVEDSRELEIEIKDLSNQEKPMVSAVQELLDGELEWRNEDSEDKEEK